MKLKNLFLNTAVLFVCVSAVCAADVKDLFWEFPSEIVKSVDKNASIIETDTEKSLLKLKFPKDFSGEFKVLAKKKDETIVGFSVYSCDESDLEIWSHKKGAWKNINDSALPKFGQKDVLAMLSVSPAIIEDLNEKVSIPYFFSFDSPSDLKLVVRKQTGCEVAGTVYDYLFNGKKFIKK